MTQVTLDIPDDLLPHRPNTPDDLAQQLQLAAAVYWYARGDISQGNAAQLAGMNRRDFLETLARDHIDVFQVDFDDLEREIARD